MDDLLINKELYTNILGYISERGYAYNTIKSYKSNLRKLLKGHKVLNQELVSAYLKKHPHAAQRVVTQIINSYCGDSDIDFHVFVPKVKQKPTKIPEILTIDEIKIIVKSVPHPYNLMLRCVFSIGAGLRISEAIKLCWHNVRWAEWLKNKEYGVAVLKETKRDNDRVVNIPNEIMSDLYALAKERHLLNEFGIPKGSLIFPIDTNNYKRELFANNKEKWKNEYVKHAYDWFRHNIIKKCCEKALNKPLHAHMLRHSRATYLYEVEGLPIERVQQLLGHKDLKNTMIYTRIDPKSTFNMMKNTEVV